MLDRTGRERGVQCAQQADPKPGRLEEEQRKETFAEGIWLAAAQGRAFLQGDRSHAVRGRTTHRGNHDPALLSTRELVGRRTGFAADTGASREEQPILLPQGTDSLPAWPARGFSTNGRHSVSGSCGSSKADRMP